MSTSSRLDKIVIVDDDARIRDLLRRFLSQEGFDVLLAEDGRALDRILQRETIDLMVLDLMLPGEDGRVHGVTVRGRYETSEWVVQVGPAGSSLACLPALDTTPAQYEVLP